MSNITRLHHVLPLSQDINKALAELDSAIAKAIDTAKAAGLPQGVIVAILHGHTHMPRLTRWSSIDVAVGCYHPIGHSKCQAIICPNMLADG